MQRLCFVVTSLFAVASATAQAQWWVSPTGNNANPGTAALPFQTINHAAAVAAAGDVIRLIAATYGNEQGNVVLGTKNLTLVGAGQGATIIKSHTSLDITLPAGNSLVTPVAEAHRCALVIQGAATVRVRDLTLDNGFSLPATGNGLSLWVGTGADAVLDNVELTNARANPITGIQGPLAVRIRGDAVADLTTVTMRNCLVHEYGKGGVIANFNAHVVMDECRVDGFNHAFLSLAAQNAVQISRGATCDIRRCTITDSWYDPPSNVATGMLFYEPGSPIVVEDCNFGNCQVGLYFFGGVASTISGSIRRNRVHTAEYGFYSQNISGLTVSDNSFSVTLAGDNNDAWDDAGGNTFSGNHYSSVTVAGPYTLPGTGASSDPLAKPLAKGFGPAIVTNLPSGFAPIDLVVGNLDADTDSDFAALCQGPTPSLALGLNSGGTFAVTNVPFGVAAGAPVAVVAGEFNGAAGRDLAVLTVSVPPSLVEHKVYVFANNGAGAFSLLHTHSIAGAVSPSGLAAGMLDADSIDDLVVSDAGSAGLIAGNAKALLNNGAGTGFAPVALAAAYTVACRDASVGDLNGDTFADIAVAEGDAGSGRVHLFQGNGSGGFVAFGASPIALSANSNRVLATDVEGDGDIDLLVSSSRDAFGFGPGGVDVLRNDAGVFTRSLFVVDRGPTEMVAGDLDADADPDTVRRDVALVNFVGGSITVLGSWSRQGAGTGGIVKAGTLATGIGLADIGGDGFADLVYCDAAAGTVVVLPGVPQARADSYGAGSAGTSALVPNLYPVGIPAVPVIGNATFGLGLRNARGFSIAVIAAALDPAAPLLPNSILVANIGATWAVVTNVFGASAVPLPVPSSAMLAGMPVYCQAGVFDQNGNDTFLPGFALTNGLKLRLGY